VLNEHVDELLSDLRVEIAFQIDPVVTVFFSKHDPFDRAFEFGFLREFQQMIKDFFGMIKQR